MACDVGPVAVSAYLKGRIKSMKRHTDAEVDALAACMSVMRQRCSPFCTYASLPMYISFYGFGNDFERSVLLCCLKFCLRPRLVHSTFMSNGDFEGILLNSSNMKFSEIETLFDHFKLSLGAQDLETFMCPQMVSCIDRIQSGKRVYGNWRCKKTESIRGCFEAHRMRRDAHEARQTVARETGFEFTTGNMLLIHHLRRNAEIDLANAHSVLRGVQHHLTYMIGGNARLQQFSSELVTSDANSHIENSLEMQYQSMVNIEGMLTSALPRATDTVDLIVVDLT